MKLIHNLFGINIDYKFLKNLKEYLMSFRKIVSLTTLLSFLLMCYTGLIIIIVPEGRVAYWSNWSLLGLNKEQYGQIHTTSSLLFLVVSFLHIYLNWKAIMLYLKNKAKNFVLFTPNFIISLTIILLVYFGSYYKMSPFIDLFVWQSDIDDYWADTYGEPPYGHAELTPLSGFAKKLDINLEKAEDILKKNNIRYENATETILQIAQKNQKTPQDIYLLIKNATNEPKKSIENDQSSSDRPTEGSGLGKKSIKLVIEKYHLNESKVYSYLQNENIKFTPESTMSEISTQKGVVPMELYELLEKIK